MATTFPAFQPATDDSLTPLTSMEATLEEAYATFAAEKARLIARTENAGALVMAALSQLRRPLAPVAPASTNRQQPAGARSSVDAAKLRERDAALAKKLQALKAQVAQQLAAIQQLPQQADSPCCPSPDCSLADVAQGDQLQLAEQHVQQLQQGASLLEEQVKQAVVAAVPHLATAAAAASLAQPGSAGVAEEAVPVPLAAQGALAATAMGPQPGADGPPAAQSAIAPYLQRFSLGMDWSAVPLGHPQQGQSREAFQPSTLVRDFACQQDEVAAYLTTQAGQRDGKRRRLAAGMLAQSLAIKPLPQPPSSGTEFHEQDSLAAEAWCYLQPPQQQQQQHFPVPLRPPGSQLPAAGCWQEDAAGDAYLEGGELDEEGTMGATPSFWQQQQQQPVPGSMGGMGEEAGWGSLPLSGLPSRTPKRKRSARSSNGDSPCVLSALAPAFSLLGAAEHGRDALLEDQFSTTQQHEPVRQPAKQDQQQEHEYETFRLFDELWHGGRRRSSLQAMPMRRAAQSSRRRGGPGDGSCVIC